ncbi:MAG: lysostaphin resistance A-like protein [Flavobacteriales bacterium]
MLERFIKPSLSDSSPAYSIFWLIMLVFIFGSLFTLSGLLISQLIFPIDIAEGLEDLGNPEVIQMLRFNQLLSAIGIFVAPSIYFAYMKGNSPKRWYGMKAAPVKWLVFSCLVILFFVPIVSVLHEWNQMFRLPEALQSFESYLREMEDRAEELTKAFLVTDSVGSLLYTLLIIAILPALGEELLFRGALQSELERWFRSGHLAVWVAAAIFSFIHFQFYGFLPRLVLGAVLGYLYLYSNKLWLPIAGHFTNNAFGVLWFHLEELGKVPSEKESGIADSWPGLLIAFLLMIGALMLLRAIKRENEKSRYMTYGG